LNLRATGKDRFAMPAAASPGVRASGSATPQGVGNGLSFPQQASMP
jgi:hypothetical protein